ncbi:CAAD domain-containing protein [Prochlorococcus sp. MIT 1323]|uniref:CAAD domain-containing protein n=1 Tax=Prochlorococcus sp. MIT 1323 TaxID=3082526 RepID=UPI0039B6E5C6
MSSAEESKAEGTSEATEGTESSSEPAESSAAANDIKVSAAQGASSQANPAVPKTPAQQQPAPAQDSPPIPKPSTIPSSPTPTPTSSDASDDLKVSAAQGASSQANPAVPKTPAQQQPAPAQDSPPIPKPSTTPSSPTPTPTSSDASDDLKVSAAQGASSQANPAVPKTPAQQQPAPAQDSPPIPKPSTTPSSPTPTPTSSDASDDLKVSAAQGASSQANPAVPKTPAQQQPAPAQDSPPIPKPSTIPSSPTPTPTSSDGPEGLDQGEELKLLLERLRNFFKLSNWIKQDDQTSPWQQLRRPVLLIAALITLVIFVRIYGGILSTIESVPLAPSLFELAGILWLTWFSITRLIRSEDRQDVISRVRTRWEAFRGTTDNKP